MRMLSSKGALKTSKLNVNQERRVTKDKYITKTQNLTLLFGKNKNVKQHKYVSYLYKYIPLNC